MLTQLTYASRETENLNSQDLSAIVASSLRNNALYGLTGALCYANGTFLQYFEGERSAVDGLYLQLLKDKRHNQLRIVSAYAITERRFPTWAMGYFSYESDIGQLFVKHCKRAELSQFSMTASDVSKFFDEVVKYISIVK